MLLGKYALKGARRFVKKTELLILDQPLHGLDVVNKKRVKEMLEKPCDFQKSLICVTHYENEILVVLNKRKLLVKNK